MSNQYEPKFEDLDDFLDSLLRGREIVIEYHGKQYGIFYLEKGFYVAQSYHDETKKVYSTPDDALKYTIDGVKIKDIITPEDFTEDIFRKVAELLYEQKKSGTVNPAQIISLFAEEEEQREVAELFHARIHEVDSAAERDKALKETILRVKDNSISCRSAHLEPTDIQGLQQIVADKRTLQNMEKMHISID